MTNIAVFKNDVAGTNIEEIYRLSRCGNLAPLTQSTRPSLAEFTATKAVAWENSQTIDETRLDNEQDNEYENRMKNAVNTALSELNDNVYEASIMSVGLFVKARGN